MLPLNPMWVFDPLHVPITNPSKLDSVHGIIGPADSVIGANPAILDSL